MIIWLGLSVWMCLVEIPMLWLYTGVPDMKRWDWRKGRFYLMEKGLKAI